MDQMNFQPNQPRQYTPMTLGDWLITILIQAIPLVGFIMLFVWAFGYDTHPSKKTWAQAMLIFAAIMIVLAIIFIGAIIAMFGSMFSGYPPEFAT